MNPYNNDLHNSLFDHIYVESKALKYPLTKKILQAFTNPFVATEEKQIPISPSIIEIHHYKDVFNRSNQNFALQKQNPKLILAVKEGSMVYQGAPVCQSFGNQHFYYTSCMMNCIYDCEYCYLQGMYPSANIVIFVNLESIFQEVRALLKVHPVYLCISYDTDLLALESKLGIVHQWYHFLEQEENLTIELRTKSANFASIKDLPANSRFILAWTLSPSQISEKFEHKAPSITSRLHCIKDAQNLGYSIRLCFDPILYVNDWEKLYRELLDEVLREVDLAKIKDISIGVFRISTDYLKIMRKQRPNSSIVQYPYQNDRGVSHVNANLVTQMIDYMTHRLETVIPKEKLFIWKETIS